MDRATFETRLFRVIPELQFSPWVSWVNNVQYDTQSAVLCMGAWSSAPVGCYLAARGRLRITDDIVKHLSTFQRLGEHLEIQAPGEMLPIGARTVFRALRTRATVRGLTPHSAATCWSERTRRS